MRFVIPLALLLAAPSFAADALDELNVARAHRGLRPFARDAVLSIGAEKCVQYRAARLIEGHVGAPKNMRPGRWYKIDGPGDHQFLPAFSNAVGGAGAARPGEGWRSCCSWENWRYAGAAKVMGRDGQFYYQLFVRN